MDLAGTSPSSPQRRSSEMGRDLDRRCAWIVDWVAYLLFQRIAGEVVHKLHLPTGDVGLDIVSVDRLHSGRGLFTSGGLQDPRVVGVCGGVHVDNSFVLQVRFNVDPCHRLFDWAVLYPGGHAIVLPECS